MEGFVYKWTNTFNRKWYIGSHKGTPEDGYTASGWDITEAFSKYGIESFSREIIYQGEDFRELEEFILVTLDAKSDSTSYNMKNLACGFATGKDHPMKKPEVSAKVSKALKNKTWEEILGKEKAKDRREKQSKALKGTKVGDNNPAKRPEVRAKIAATLKGRKPSWTGKPKTPEQLAKSFVSRYCKELSQEERDQIYLQKVIQYKNR